MLHFLYHTIIGRMILKILCKPCISETAGRFLDMRASRVLINPFIRKNHIDLSQYETGFSCFNDCFCRKIKPGLREFPQDAFAFASPCDGLLSVYRINDRTVLPVKQSRYSIDDLLEDVKLADAFTDGFCLVFRLCVEHYHRYSYFDSGVKGGNIHIPGVLHTVRPVALSQVPVFVRNSREYTILQTDHFGTVVQMEVGALLVGRICNHHGAYRFRRGEEKGCFQYGGSTIIVLLQKDALQLSSPVSEIVGTGNELPVQMGDVLGFAETHSRNGSH
ncbi:MAG: phosphatidylserine decarboxylase [Lachnospiraceae bacterium]|nr:phosphatidylserine decarboxylase [Lachnospiraceae bacterium]